MAASPIPPTFAERAGELARLQGRTRAARRRELEALYQVSSSTMSRWLNAIGIRFSERGDRGKRRTEITDSHLQAVFAIQYSSYKQQQGPIMTAAVAIEIAEHNNRIPVGILTASAYNAWLRATGIQNAQVDRPTRHVNLVSLGPNHVHQVDFSLAINWKIENNKAIYQHLVYKNKLPAAGDPRLLRMICTDHCSGNFFVWYTVAPGENVSALIEGLWHAWTPKLAAGKSVAELYPFRGVPRILMMDRGPGSKSQILQNFLTWLGVTQNICVGARSKGQVESAHWLWERTFESRFRSDPPVDVALLNDEAVKWAANFCATAVHFRTRASRTAHWEFHLNRKFESQLRVPNCSFSEAKRYAVTTAKESSVAGDGTIRFNGERYRVPETLLHERKVLVSYSPFEFPNIVVRAQAPNAQPFFCSPIVRNEHGFDVEGAVIGQQFKAHKDDARTRMVKDAKQAVKQMVAGERLVTRGYHLEGIAASGIKSREAEVGAAQETAPTYTNTAARFEVIQRVGRDLSPAERRLFQRFAEAVSESEIDAVVTAIADGVGAAVVPMRVVSA